MSFLVFGFALLGAARECQVRPALRESLASLLGTGAGMAALGTCALAGAACVVYGRSIAPYRFVWLPPAWLQAFVLPLVYVAFIFIAAAIVRSNLNRWTAHPVAWGVLLIALAHLGIQEDVAGLLLFAGLGSLALLEIARPPAARPRATAPLPWIREAQTVALGGVLFLVAFFLHAPVLGVAPVMAGRSAF